jgi:16S rRNA (guanine966-N2)-methyltransferase
MLSSRIGSFEGLRVADLFAGSGALGLEALSRGAAYCRFVEKDRAALTALAANIDRLGAAPRAEVHSASVEQQAVPSLPFDLVLMDPPYRQDLAQPALDRIAMPGWLAPGAWVSVETSGDEPVAAPPLRLEAQRRFGKAFLFLLRNGE